MGTITPLDADVLCKYIIAENEYLRLTNNVTMALNRGDSADAEKWINAQCRVQRESLLLAEELGLTAQSRKKRGIPYPYD